MFTSCGNCASSAGLTDTPCRSAAAARWAQCSASASARDCPSAGSSGPTTARAVSRTASTDVDVQPPDELHPLSSSSSTRRPSASSSSCCADADTFLPAARSSASTQVTRRAPACICTSRTRCYPPTISASATENRHYDRGRMPARSTADPAPVPGLQDCSGNPHPEYRSNRVPEYGRIRGPDYCGNPASPGGLRPGSRGRCVPIGGVVAGGWVGADLFGFSCGG